jgi:hypothetical protein
MGKSKYKKGDKVLFAGENGIGRAGMIIKKEHHDDWGWVYTIVRTRVVLESEIQDTPE